MHGKTELIYKSLPCPKDYLFYTRDHKIQAFHTKKMLTLGQGRRLQIKLKSTFQGFIDVMNSKMLVELEFLQFDFF